MSEPIRVIRGQPSQDDLAALVSVLLILRDRHLPADDSADESPVTWTRGRAYEAPGAWSSGNAQGSVTHV